MKPERWQEVQKLYLAALEYETSTRAAFLERACAGDAALLDEVETLLRCGTQAEGFITVPALEMAARLVGAEADSSLVGRRLGRYRILSRLGSGGMGSVYLASRADDQFQKRVAIKLLKRGLDTAEIVRRFRYERQILASLNHPNIARLLDGDTTEDGLPYFVMEYIEGQPIDAYCDSHRLTISERLRLFLTVCGAVHYAHQNLVVHRDLKPGNILVPEDGSPKLLDFGIAKLLSPDLFPETVAPTATWERPMTPAYASPEQVRGQAITTASDVYSLGVVLYELLTGHRPYRITSSAPSEIARVVCEAEPERPSTAISRVETLPGSAGEPTAITPESVSLTREGEPERLRRRLKGDLDNIVLMAMRKEPQRRYASVEQFAEDIRRHLEGLPVIARKDTFGYRAGKFVRRNRAGVAAAAVIAALIIGFIVTTLMQTRRVARERDRAERVLAFLVDTFKVSDPTEAKGNTITAREILDQGAEKIRQELKDQPEAQATLMNTMGNAYRSLGLYDRATPLLEEALKTRRQLFGNEHADVASTLHDLGMLRFDKGDYAGAEALHREALAIRRRRLGEEHLAVAESLNALGGDLRARSDLAAAEPLYREALSMRRKLVGQDDATVAQYINDLALLLTEKGDFAAAEPLQREALGLQRRLLGDAHSEVATSLNNLALLLQRKGDDAAAVPYYRESLEIRRRLYGEEHPNVAFAMANLASAIYLTGDPAGAEPLFRRALELRCKLLPPGHLYIGHSLMGLGKVLTDKGDPQGAEPLLREGVEIFRQKLPPGEWRTADAESSLAGCLTALGRYSEAEPLLVGNYPILKAKTGERSKQTVRALNRIIALYEAWGRPEKAAEYRALLAR
ncbi:MAG TPA: serine/threonine-protein kinase [Blastocatellia bacterium]|nr:serine/threonine-protein kinase [Blastocatellia bacterium]